MSHSRAKLNPFGQLLCERIAAGFSVGVAAQMVGISHARAYVIWRRSLAMRVRPRSSCARADPIASPDGTSAPLGARIDDQVKGPKTQSGRVIWNIESPDVKKDSRA